MPRAIGKEQSDYGEAVFIVNDMCYPYENTAI